MREVFELTDIAQDFMIGNLRCSEIGLEDGGFFGAPLLDGVHTLDMVRGGGVDHLPVGKRPEHSIQPM